MPPAFFGDLEKSCEFNDQIEIVEIETDKPIMIKYFKGQNINTIKISGKQKTIQNLCPFLDTLNALPKLKKVVINSAEVLGFESNQDCGNDDLVKPLKPHTSEVQVKEIQ